MFTVFISIHTHKHINYSYFNFLFVILFLYLKYIEFYLIKTVSNILLLNTIAIKYFPLTELLI